uniref:Uncharacterized protein n=1 Tax=Anguilla anguilla TaxID=7936 RepID=A0A0E9PF71_ANGAN
MSEGRFHSPNNHSFCSHLHVAAGTPSTSASSWQQPSLPFDFISQTECLCVFNVKL